MHLLRVDFAFSSGHRVAEEAPAGGTVTWYTGCGRFLSQPLLIFFFFNFFFPLLSARTCCAAPLTSTSLLQAWSSAWDRCYLGDGSGRTGYLTLRVFGANNTRIVSQIDRAEGKWVRSFVWTGSLWLGRFCHMTMLWMHQTCKTWIPPFPFSWSWKGVSEVRTAVQSLLSLILGPQPASSFHRTPADLHFTLY